MSHQSASKHLHQLTALRFFAAFAVLLSHLAFLKDQQNPLHGLANTIFYEGYAGVTFFFVLSGFILSHTYQSKVSSKEVSGRKYFLLRLARIYPLHFLTALPFAIIAFYKLGASAFSKVALNTMLLQSWVPESRFYYSLNSVSWSLSNELFFYASFIFLTTLSSRVLGRIAIVWVIVILFAAIVGIYTGLSSWHDGRVHYLFYISPVTRLLDFIVGMLVYRWSSTHGYGKTSFHEIASVAILIGAMYVFSTHQLPNVLRSQLLYLPLMAYIVWSFAGGGGLVSRAIAHPSIVLLGDASFALYMIHQPIITHGYSAYNKLQLSFGLVTIAVILAAVSIGVSVAIYRYIELPIHNRLRRWIGKLN
jgi:peptidoglycan/LPS O-acetylase OafA/YrhL